MKYVRDKEGKAQFIILDNRHLLDLVHCCVQQCPETVEYILLDKSLTKVECQWNMLPDVYGPLRHQISFRYESNYIVFINEWRYVDPDNVSFMLFKQCYDKEIAVALSLEGYNTCIVLDNLFDDHRFVFDLNKNEFTQINKIRLREVNLNYELDNLYYTEGVYVHKELCYELGKIYMYRREHGVPLMAGFSFNARTSDIRHLKPITLELKPLSLSTQLI